MHPRRRRPPSRGIALHFPLLDNGNKKSTIAAEDIFSCRDFNRLPGCTMEA